MSIPRRELTEEEVAKIEQELIGPDQALSDLSLAGQLLDAASSTDELLEALVRSNNAIARMMLQSNMAMGSDEILGGLDRQNLPRGVAGFPLGGIDKGSIGPAVFVINGTRILQAVTAEAKVDADDVVVINGEGNSVRPEDKGIIPALQAQAKDVVSPDAWIDVANEEWVNNSGSISPTITAVSFSGNLNAGDTENVATVRSSVDTIQLEIYKVGMTDHQADIDGDNKDERVVEYLIQYQEEPGGGWLTLDGPSGFIPIGSITNPQEVLEEGKTLGDIYGFRVRFDNRTDDTAFTDTQVAEDDMGARIVGRAVRV